MKIKISFETIVDDCWFFDEEEKELFINSDDNSRRLWLFERFHPYIMEDDLIVEVIQE